MATTIVKSIRMVPGLWARVEESAVRLGVSPNAYVVSLIERGLGDPGVGADLPVRPVGPPEVRRALVPVSRSRGAVKPDVRERIPEVVSGVEIRKASDMLTVGPVGGGSRLKGEWGPRKGKG